MRFSFLAEYVLFHQLISDISSTATVSLQQLSLIVPARLQEGRCRKVMSALIITATPVPATAVANIFTRGHYQDKQLVGFTP